MRYIIKLYLKSLPRNQRDVRLMFLGKRLKVKQLKYLYFNNHPFETHH